MLIKIPKSFKLLASTITVRYDDEACNNGQMTGEYFDQQQEIILCNTYDNKKVPKDLKLDSYYHEKVHAILAAMNEDRLYKNEKFVDMFAKLLRQSDETSVYK